jgi:hypothetical protein
MPIHFLSSFDDEDIPTAATLLCKRKSQLSAVADASITFAEGHTLELGLGSGTPLHRAVGRRNVKAVAASLEIGADPMAKDCVGVTTLGFAARFHLADILHLCHRLMALLNLISIVSLSCRLRRPLHHQKVRHFQGHQPVHPLRTTKTIENQSYPGREKGGQDYATWR